MTCLNNVLSTIRHLNIRLLSFNKYTVGVFFKYLLYYKMHIKFNYLYNILYTVIEIKY